MADALSCFAVLDFSTESTFTWLSDVGIFTMDFFPDLLNTYWLLYEALVYGFLIIVRATWQLPTGI